MTKIKHAKMVGWYDPVQLGKTALQVLISTIFGRHADKRIMQALSSTGDLQKKCYYEVVCSSNREFWFDYISDVGDGFDATYTMAYHLTRPTLSLETHKKLDEKENESKPYETKRGELLVFGGDEVYPTADFQTYKERLISLYEALFPKKSKEQKEKLGKAALPAVFAVPGNHDWYDSLVAFSEIFCTQKEFAGWQTHQNHSYFAIKLPKGWWLFGTDMQLGSSLDNAQIDYFKKVMVDVKPEDRIILCNAEPHWITAKMYANDPAFNNRNLGYFEGGVLKKQTAVYVAGDRHYYRRHEEISNYSKIIDPDSKSKVQKIVAGGGGAFLHPTHNEHVDEIGRQHIFKLKETYPDESKSRSLTYRSLLFPLWNLKFGLVTGVMYLLTAQAFLSNLGSLSLSNLTGAIKTVIIAMFTQPIALFWTILIFIGFLVFTDTHSKRYRWIAGPIHAIAHLAAVFFIGWIVAYCVGGDADLKSRSLPQLAAMGALIFAGGAIAGSFIMGIYLFVSLNCFGRHHNETFSAIKIPDYKNFLRFRIDETSGDLTIYPIGVERAIKNWKDGDKSKGEPETIPDNLKKENEAFLLEEPIGFAKSFTEDKPPLETVGDVEPCHIEERNLKTN